MGVRKRLVSLLQTCRYRHFLTSSRLITRGNSMSEALTSKAKLIIFCGCAIALLAFGPRSAMGFFQQPVLDSTGWGSATFGLAIAIQNLAWGIGQPIFGALADRYGAYKSLAAGGIIYALGLYIMGTAEAPIWLHIGGGILVGLGVAAGSFGIILSVFARNVNPEQRSLVFGHLVIIITKYVVIITTSMQPNCTYCNLVLMY